MYTYIYLNSLPDRRIIYATQKYAFQQYLHRQLHNFEKKL